MFPWITKSSVQRYIISAMVGVSLIEAILTIDNSKVCRDEVCVFTDFSICLLPALGTWESRYEISPIRLTNREGVYNPQRRSSYCYQRFEPEYNSLPNNSAQMHVYGNTYLACCWSNHIGHIYVDMVAPMITSVLSVGYSPAHVKFLVDNRLKSPSSSQGTISKVLKLFSPNVYDLKSLSSFGKLNNFSRVCFENMIVGVQNMELLHPSKQHIFESSLRSVRNSYLRSHLVQYDAMPLSHACTVVVEQRNHSRRILNIFDVMRSVHDIFSPGWNVRRVTFEHLSLPQQAALMSRANVVVSVSGTGSHLSLFSPDRSANVVIVSRANPNVNTRICAFAHFKCFQVEALAQCNVTHSHCRRGDDVIVNIPSLNAQLLHAHAHVKNTCI